LVDGACIHTAVRHRFRFIALDLYRCQSLQRVQDLQILQTLCEGWWNMWRVQVVCLASVSFVIWASIGQAQNLNTAQAKAHEGETGTVCGKVAGERTATSSRGEPTFINLDAAYPNQVFTILVWGDDRKNVGELPQVGARVCASGKIEDYRGVPEIVVRTKGQLVR
jgi:hypothetical protein